MSQPNLSASLQARNIERPSGTERGLQLRLLAVREIWKRYGADPLVSIIAVRLGRDATAFSLGISRGSRSVSQQQLHTIRVAIASGLRKQASSRSALQSDGIRFGAESGEAFNRLRR